MILDKQNQYSAEQEPANGDPSTNVIDHSPAKTPAGLSQDLKLGIGNPMAVVIIVKEIKSSAGDEVYTAVLQTDNAVDANDQPTFASPTGLASLSIPRTSLPGDKFVMVVPPDMTFERFSRIQYGLGGTLPAITVDAYMVPVNQLQNWLPYASGWEIKN